MMEEWRTIRLGDACVTNADTYTPKEGWQFVNYLDTGNITDNRIDSIQHISIGKDKLPSRARRKVKKDSIVYSTVRPNQRHFGIIKTQPGNFLVSTGFAVIDVDTDVLDAAFTYYLLSQPSIVETLHAIAEQSTSAYPSIKPSDIEDLDIEVPDLATQKKISRIISSLERKITLNIAINENLEEQAQSIFMNMFPNIMSANGSERLESYISFSNGKKRPQSDGIIPVYGGNGVLAYSSESNADNCVIIGRVGAYCGNTFLCPDKCWVSDNAIQAKSKHTESQLFIYYLLKNASLQSRHIGTGQPLMTQGILNSIPICAPTATTVNSFIEVVSPTHNLIELLNSEIKRLASIRNTLLPRLMSGVLDVSDLDI